MPINPFVFRRMGLDTVPVTEGGMLPPFVTSEPRINIDNNIFSGSGFGFDNFGQGTLGGGSSGGIGGVGGGVLSPPTVVTIGDGTPTEDKILFTGGKSGDPLIDKLTAEEIARLNAIEEKAGRPPLTEKKANEVFVDQTGKVTSIASQIADYVVKELPKVYESQDAAATAAATAAARTGAATGNSGIPLIIPIPGIDPVTGLAITAAGLIFSGGNVAKLDPANPIGSVIDAGKGTIKTIGNVADVVTGQTDLSDIWGAGSTSGSGSGSGAGAGAGTGSAAGAGTGSTAGTGSITGGQNEVIGIDPSGLGAIGVLGTGSSSGTSQPPAGSSSVSVTPGALGGATAGQTQTSNIASSAQIAQARANINAANQAAAAVLAANTSNVDTSSNVSTGTNTNTTTNTNTDTNQTTNTGTATAVTPIDWSKVNAAQAAAAQDKINRDAAAIASLSTDSTNTSCPAGQELKNGKCVPIVITPPPVTSCPAGQELKNGACVPIVVGPSTTTPPGSTTVSTTPIVTTPTFTFTSPTNTGLAQRDYAKEFGLTAQTLTGQPGSDLASYYQKLQQQFTPSSLTTLGREAESQLAADLARYNEAQRGNLSAEDVRTAQQGAREAYAARGQVMGRGAIGAEILNRDALQRQREAEARASVQQSMGNLANAANLQTGNIFSPFASLISQTYSPTNQYAREVYDYNVNAYNAYQAAEKNLAAYKEAAAKGQEAQFINSFVGFLANNGIQTTTNAVTSILNGLLGGGTKKPGT